MKPLAIVVLLGIAKAQPAFEVASVKLGRLTGGSRGGCHGIDSSYSPNEAASAPPLGRCVIRDSRLSHLLFFAYHLSSMGLLKGGPDWVEDGDDRFDVEAKAEDPTKATEEDLRKMLQTLLTERFRLKFHRETREIPGFELLIAKNGPKLESAKGDEVSSSSPNGKARPGQLNTLIFRKYSTAKLAEFLAQFGPPVIDKTGLSGAYDFTLSWDETNGPQLSTALQQQLGLKFESQKVPVSFIVIESAQKPTEN
jgi:uncharacterized protein (TIGR03435 family)